jgi:hypothetical protein
LLSFGAECFVFQFASKYIKIKIYRNIILPIVLNACETWLLTLREERRPRVSENRVLREYLGQEGKGKKEGSGENYIMRSLMICTPHQTVWVIESRRIRWAGHVVRMGERSIQGFVGEI